MVENNLSLLLERLKPLGHLKSALAVLSWDQEVNMPPAGMKHRAETIAHLSGLLHEEIVALNHDQLLDKLKLALNAGQLDEDQAPIVREVWRDYQRETKLSTQLVQEIAKLTAEATVVWAKARETNDFSLFLPYLQQVIAKQRQMADCFGYPENGSPYDALIDLFEPGLTSQETFMIFEPLKDFLITYLAKIQNSPVKVSRTVLHGQFPIETQCQFNQMVAEKMGFDCNCGRIDKSTHPFATGFHPTDVRITARFDPEDLFYSLECVTHEVGHALYEQGLAIDYFGTPLGEALSLGVHESQSRMWENMIGKGRPFWRYFYPLLQQRFPDPYAKLDFEAFYKAINCVAPTLIRTEADEVTYNLHIIMRFELEKELIEGTLDPANLPQVWNQKVKDYFGIDVPNDKQGVLQDVHWAHGTFGYFPTYTFGNLYAAQFYRTMEQQLLTFEQDQAAGNLLPIREWLRTNIHLLGRRYEPRELLKKVTGEELKTDYFIEYLTKKYNEIYQLD